MVVKLLWLSLIYLIGSVTFLLSVRWLICWPVCHNISRKSIHFLALIFMHADKGGGNQKTSSIQEDEN